MDFFFFFISLNNFEFHSCASKFVQKLHNSYTSSIQQHTRLLFTTKRNEINLNDSKKRKLPIVNYEKWKMVCLNDLETKLFHKTGLTSTSTFLNWEWFQKFAHQNEYSINLRPNKCSIFNRDTIPWFSCRLILTISGFLYPLLSIFLASPTVKDVIHLLFCTRLPTYIRYNHLVFGVKNGHSQIKFSCKSALSHVQIRKI